MDNRELGGDSKMSDFVKFDRPRLIWSAIPDSPKGNYQALWRKFVFTIESGPGVIGSVPGDKFYRWRVELVDKEQMLHGQGPLGAGGSTTGWLIRLGEVKSMAECWLSDVLEGVEE